MIVYCEITKCLMYFVIGYGSRLHVYYFNGYVNNYGHSK